MMKGRVGKGVNLRKKKEKGGNAASENSGGQLGPRAHHSGGTTISYVSSTVTRR